jgi:hypothetical protein
MDRGYTSGILMISAGENTTLHYVKLDVDDLRKILEY